MVTNINQKLFAFYKFGGYNNIADRNMLYTCVTELTFKRLVKSPATRKNRHNGGFFVIE